ncbi:VanZ family protein [Kitasatospora sp. NPDC005748]|uniref:VanZ family protein n=1 Tax=Kitasatospora sp. NPDC005748 TaxID=3157063 RepID=UPI0033D5E354
MTKELIDTEAGDGPRGGARWALAARLRRRDRPAPPDHGQPSVGAPDGTQERAPERRSWASAAGRWLILLAAFLAMVGFAVLLARITLVPAPGAVGRVHSNLRPGDSLRHYLLHAVTLDALRQVGGNVLLGVPFGLLLPVLWPRARGLFRVLIRTAAVMVLVELVQGALITGRAFDIDDVILNTLGALLGYLVLGRRLVRTVHPEPRTHLRQDNSPEGQGN